MLWPSGLPGVFWQNRQHQQAHGKKRCMNPCLGSRAKTPRKKMRVEVAKQEDYLKEQQADRPDRRDSSKPGKNDFSNQRLHLEEKKRAQENRHRVQEIRWMNPHVSPEPRRRDGRDYTKRSASLQLFFLLGLNCGPLAYSYRSATIGSTRIARRAGM